ncbi:phosphatidylcholine transfer protein-like [Schistocerca gregaria]|uniref:phosphatidylcholine transfer protein-like n=1 Tax=Schistocerca gregaria TaxID=7010 RepID=UPI00211E7765|nr:phosphatidylcholine transfer protein-like [Schistocerca gregaria]XP_049850532.1 phosphatidylcholine transfer protein-like [Schistocerca gregaria]
MDLNLQLLVDILEDFERLRSGDTQNWEKVADCSLEKYNVKIWRTSSSRTDTHKYIYKLLGVFKDVSLDLFSHFYGDLETRKSWDTRTRSIDVLGKVDAISLDSEHSTSEGQLIRWQIPVGWMFSDRVYIFTRYKVYFRGAHFFVDVQHPKVDDPALTKGAVAVKDYNAVTLFTGEGDSVLMYQNFVTAFDLQMSLPSWFINWATGLGLRDLISSFKTNYFIYSKNLEKQGQGDSNSDADSSEANNANQNK